MSCETACYEVQINACDDITLKAGLAANTAYFVLINKVASAHVYQRQLTTDGDGNLVISKDAFPAGYFNAYAGYFQLVLRSSTDYTQIQPMTFNTIQYSCVIFKIAAVNVTEEDTSPITTIQ